MAKHKIKLLPDGRRLTGRAGSPLLEALTDSGVRIYSPCGGRGLCGSCQVQIAGPGRPVSAEEHRHLSRRQIEEGWRLACRQTLDCDLAVTLTESIDFAQAKIKLAELETGALSVRGVPRKVVFTPREMTLEELNIPFAEALAAALPPQVAPPARLELLRRFTDLLQEGHQQLTLVVERDRLVGVEAGDTTGALYGAAVDIGTTTIALYLCDLATGRIISGSARTNSQAVHGADVMSRIGFCHFQPDGLEKMRDLVRGDIQALADECCRKAGADIAQIYRWVLVGNTTMQHLFFGFDPFTLGFLPYLPLVNGAVSFDPADCGLAGASCASGHFLPILAGHVGADTVGVALAAGLDRAAGVTLAVDLGTNGEIILADNGRMVASSTAAGPAFEGMRIACGMRAEPGAVDRFWIGEDGEPGYHVVGDTPARGICGSGLMDIAAGLLAAGVIDGTGWLLPPEKLPEAVPQSLAGRLEQADNGQWQFVVADPAGGRRVVLTQRDVRELQLAAGAISAGIGILLHKAGRQPKEIERVLLTGAFGHFLDPESALVIGLIREVPLERIQSIGNAAGLGARMALVDSQCFDRALAIARSMEFVELGAEKDWNERFTEAMIFPPAEGR